MTNVLYTAQGKSMFLKPVYQMSKGNKPRLMGAQIYSLDNVFKGYWHVEHMPTDVKQMLLLTVKNQIRRDKEAAKVDTTWLAGDKR
jgi:hypothetical protein